MIFKGFRFGLIIQLSVGPVCLYVFQSACAQGFLSGFTAALAAALVDAFYISLAACFAALLSGIGKHQRPLRIFGGIILILFGVVTMLAAFGISVLPHVSVSSGGSPFFYCMLLTLSNPLTILFWGGVFTARTTDSGWNRTQIFDFGLGCVFSTVLFLTLIAAIGALAHRFLPAIALTLLNTAVGAVLVVMGGKLIFTRSHNET